MNRRKIKKMIDLEIVRLQIALEKGERGYFLQMI